MVSYCLEKIFWTFLNLSHTGLNVVQPLSPFSLLLLHHHAWLKIYLSSNIKNHVPIILEMKNVQYTTWAELFKIHTWSRRIIDHIIPPQHDKSRQAKENNFFQFYLNSLPFIYLVSLCWFGVWRKEKKKKKERELAHMPRHITVWLVTPKVPAASRLPQSRLYCFSLNNPQY